MLIDERGITTSNSTNAIVGNEPRRSEAMLLLSPFQGDRYPWLNTDAPYGACLPWRPHSTNPAIADAECVAAVSD